MEIGSVGAYVSAALDVKQNNLMNQVGTAMLSNTMDQMEAMGDGLTKMMEQSVNPGIGGNFDMSI